MCAKFQGRALKTRSKVGPQSRCKEKGAPAQLRGYARFALTKTAFRCAPLDACGRVVRGAINVGVVSKYVEKVCAHDGANQNDVGLRTPEYQRVEVG